ncbi:hypothetical protein BDV37DRAFT_267165 [Aspergillus pseudonomiae]|uniref:Chromo shadow domain-containing protein n=1 Tax=Aspergillus pseudonomiae TaxID=1506151 RepID=A0A5N7CRM4_9EURO|nr:uncharacterized protein BDV37DRAFT_267165 [Aspergillus pseudonomiae]KAE8396890.1 hypothetical protein BDV37DRAFT_267165 [Aspergillus pseudonomiae]
MFCLTCTADTQTDDTQRPNSTMADQSDDEDGNITRILKHRSTPEGSLTFLCLQVQWYSHSELEEYTPELVDQYLYRGRPHERSRARKRQAACETPLASDRQKKVREI